jgi:hypothetical protein
MRRFILHAFCIGLVCVLASRFIIPAHAGLRGPGKYCGVVVFVGYVFPVERPLHYLHLG